jgi:DNA-binding response OmpR family regulator
MSQRILVIEDDASIADFIRRGLTYEGYTVEVAADGEAGLAAARDRPPDLVVLDVMLPGLDGFAVCRRLRAESAARRPSNTVGKRATDDVPILMLTARGAVADRVTGLDAGADDYLTKPFAFEELLARIRALLRRTRPAAGEPSLRFTDLTLDPAARQSWRGSRAVELTAREFDLLVLFLRHPGQVLTRDVIYEAVWGYDFGGESNLADVYVRYLRNKLEAGGEPRLIQTVRGVGYVLRAD